MKEYKVETLFYYLKLTFDSKQMLDSSQKDRATNFQLLLLKDQ